MPERFFIIGCQRTGTTLLRLILECHPEIFCYDEVKAYAVLRNELPEETGCRLNGFKIPRFTEQLLNDGLTDEGLEGSWPRFYQGEKLLFMWRNVYDTIASMLKLKFGNDRSWCEDWVPRIIEAKRRNDPAFAARYAPSFDIIAVSPQRLIGLAALYWKYKTDAFAMYKAQGLPVLSIRYEDLVSDTRHTLQAVCDHLSIQLHTDMLRHNELRHTEVFSGGLTVGNTDPTKPVSSESVNQWREYLSAEELAIVEKITRPE